MNTKLHFCNPVQFLCQINFIAWSDWSRCTLHKNVQVQIFQAPDSKFGLPFSIIRPWSHFAKKGLHNMTLLYVLQNFKILVSTDLKINGSTFNTFTVSKVLLNPVLGSYFPIRAQNLTLYQACFVVVFSSPEPKAHRWAFSIPMLRRPSSVVRPSSVRPSVHNFKHLLLWNRLANQSQILCGASLGRGNESLFAASGSHDQDGHHAHIW